MTGFTLNQQEKQALPLATNSPPKARLHRCCAPPHTTVLFEKMASGCSGWKPPAPTAERFMFEPRLTFDPL